MAEHRSSAKAAPSTLRPALALAVSAFGFPGALLALFVGILPRTCSEDGCTDFVQNLALAAGCVMLLVAIATLFLGVKWLVDLRRPRDIARR